MAQVRKEAKQKPNLKFLRDKMREKVTGIFRFYEVPGGGISFNFREFKEDPIERYDLIDGETYTIPLGVARHLNNNGWYPEHEYVNVESTTSHSGLAAKNTQIRISKKIHRYGFQSLEFIDIDEFPTGDKQVVEVQTVV